jgi:tRNA(fMet)-specific endonuclease VapC
MYLLDTNICIFLKNKKPIHVLERLQQVIDNTIYISSISVMELQFGVHHSTNIEKNRISLTEFLAPFKILDFDSEDAEISGRIRSALFRIGKPIGPYDLLISGQAIAKNLTIITNNKSEFQRVEGLLIEDWKDE